MMTTIPILANGTQIKIYVSILKSYLETFGYMEVGSKETVPWRPHTDILAFLSLKKVTCAVKGTDTHTEWQCIDKLIPHYKAAVNIVSLQHIYFALYIRVESHHAEWAFGATS